MRLSRGAPRAPITCLVAPSEPTHADVLIGEFIRLRPLHVDDAEVTLRWRQGVRSALLNRGAVTVAGQADWIRSRPGSERNFVIELPDGRAVGMLSLIGVDCENRHAESARFLIGEEDAVRGIPVAVEAMKLLYELAFETLGLERVWGTVASGNKLMIKWQRYLGMREEGRLRRHYFLNGSYHDAVCLGILADEYREMARPRMEALIAAGRSRDHEVPRR
jgi:[ribosomal protein S5]-alanine N-acetyltransferase